MSTENRTSEAVSRILEARGEIQEEPSFAVMVQRVKRDFRYMEAIAEKYQRMEEALRPFAENWEAPENHEAISFVVNDTRFGDYLRAAKNAISFDPLA